MDSKRRRREFTKKINIARQATDITKVVPRECLYHEHNGCKYTVSYHKASSLQPSEVEWCFGLVRDSVKSFYDNSGGEWAWNEQKKREEMFSNTSRYILLHREPPLDQHHDLVALVHLQYDFDYGDDCLYVYEIHVDQRLRSSGIGRFLMNTCQALAHGFGLTWIRLSSFKCANKFYVDKLGYSVDENVDDSDGVHILRKRINDDDSI